MGSSCPPPIRSKYRTESVKEALTAAYNLLGNKKNWIQGELAVSCKKKNEYGEFVFTVEPKNPKARAFCALGALQHVNGPFQEEATKLLAKAATKVLLAEIWDYGESPCDHIFSVNDDEGYGAVRRMFRLAIKWAGQKKKGL